MKKYAVLGWVSVMVLLWSLPVHGEEDRAAIQAFWARHGVTSGDKVVGLYQQETSAWPGEIASGLGDRLKTDGFTVVRLSSDELCDPAILNRDAMPALVIDDIATAPVGAVAGIGEYAANGGRLIALGGPAFSNGQFRSGDAWLSREELLAKVEKQMVVHALALPGRAEGWTQARSVNSPASVLQIVTGGDAPVPPGSAVYQFTFNMGEWCGFAAEPVVVPEKDRLTVFWAKGDEAARQLSVEWAERDGSRWIGVVNLETGWKRYVLPEKAFAGWPDPRVAGRLGKGDQLHLQNGTRLRFGLAQNFTSEPGGHSYQISVAGVGTAEMPAEASQAYGMIPQTRFDVPAIETISPAYKLFAVTNLKALTATSACPAAIAPAGLPLPRTTLGIVARVQGTGLDKQRATRYVPLLECHDGSGRFTAAAAALMLPATGWKQSTWTLSVPVTDPAFFSAPQTQQWLVKVIGWLDHGVYLGEGGSEYYVSFGNENVPVGAVVVNRDSRSQDVAVTSTVTDAAGKVVFSHSFQGSVAAGSQQKFESAWAVPAVGDGVYRVSTVLEQDGQGIDGLSHEFRILPQSGHPDFVTEHDGQFWLDGKAWEPFGVNYMPSSGIGREDHDLWENFFGTRAYDPDAIERDLEDVKAMGMNMISTAVIAGDSNEISSRNVLDLLARCQALGLKVNLAIAGDSPMHFDWERAKTCIQELKLAGNDTVFAYDLDWEAHWGGQAAREQYDPQWRDWIARHYGSVEKAEAAWHFQAPSDGGEIINPTDDQFSGEGPAHAMVMDYRQFLNELLSERYGGARQSIRSIDPNHAVSFRMAFSGSAAEPSISWSAYDFVGLKNAVDFLAPEGYSVSGEDPAQCMLEGMFTVAYARAAAPDLPVIFAEFGVSCFSAASMNEDASTERIAAEAYGNFYRMVLKSGANGAVCWFFPGGFRVGENSDFGIINPDRSWRPVSDVIHDFSGRMTASRAIPRADVVIPIVLGRYEGSTPEIYQEIKDQWKKIVDGGELPGLALTR